MKEMLIRAWLLIALVGAALVAPGCAAVRAARPPPSAQQTLWVLEHDFQRFIATDLRRGPGGRPLSAEEARVQLDAQVAVLEALRMRYLDVLERTEEPRLQVLAMVRMAELHLDLGARIRRLPYPREATEPELRAYDQRLSQLAAPYEAVGRGLLAQVLDLSAREAVRGRLVERARLYMALHEAGRPRLSSQERAALLRELGSTEPFAAPRSLLDAGRVGLRAARR